MTLYEKKAAKQAELLELKEAIEAGDEDAIAKGDEIASALAELEESIAALERAQAALQSVGEEENNESEDAPMEDAKSLGEFAVKSFGEMHRGSAINVITPGYKANTDLHTTVSVPVAERSVTDIRPYVPTIRDLIASETISGNALTYYVMGATEVPDEFVIDEGAKKAQIHVPSQAKTAELQKIAAFLKESDELVEDAPWLKTAIDNRLVTDLQRAIDNFLSGSLLATSGIGSGTWASTDTATDIADAILTEAMSIEQTTGHACNGVIVSAGVYGKLRLGKDGENRYFGGGYWGEQAAATIWGMPVVVIPGSTNLAIVGDFSTASMVTNTNGIQVAMTNANEDDFVYNRVTVRAEQRVALAVRMPSAFTKIVKGN